MVQQIHTPTRPRTRAECPPKTDGERRCPWVSCRYHLWQDLDRAARRRKDAEPAPAPEDMPRPCALDHAEDSHRYEKIGALLGVTKQAVQQTEARALRKIIGRFPGLEGHLEHVTPETRARITRVRESERLRAEITAYRTARGVSLGRIARHLGITKSRASEIEGACGARILTESTARQWRRAVDELAEGGK